MEMPKALQMALELKLSGLRQADMVKDAQALSLNYRMKGSEGERRVTRDEQALAYAAARMPATFGAVFCALSEALKSIDCCPRTLLDTGAGTGAACWAADMLLSLESVTCLEREQAMRKVGSALMAEGPAVLQGAVWIAHDLVKEDILKQAELVTAAYVLNEIPEADRGKAIQKLWAATQTLLVLVEPGTPQGFEHLRKAREMLLGLGAHIAAPCPHENECPMASEDWCHFSCRVARSRLHMVLKGGEAPYEDEKFAYLAVARGKCSPANDRVLRHPKVHTGHVVLEVCASEGLLAKTLSRRDGPLYKQARNLKAGDGIRESLQDAKDPEAF